MSMFINTPDNLLDHRLKPVEICQKPVVYEFTPDHLRLNVDITYKGEFLNSLFNGYSLNSPQQYGVTIFGHVFDTYYAEHAGLKKILYLDYLGDKLIIIEKIVDGGMVQNVSYQITFHATFFYIEELQDILVNFINEYLPYLTVSRLDIALDTNVTVSEIWLTAKTRFQNFWPIIKRWKCETAYFGNKMNNSRHFIRVYDKKADTRKKGKTHIFGDYMDRDVVTRIEVQINIDSCKELGITPMNVLDRKRMYEIFKSICLNPEATNFPQIPRNGGQFIKRNKRKKVVRTDDLEKLFYLRLFYAYARRLDDLGLDVLKMVKTHLEDYRSQPREHQKKSLRQKRHNI